MARLLLVLTLLALHASPADLYAQSTSAFAPEVAYTADALTNVRGGAATRGAVLHNVDLTLGLDAETLLGWRGLTAFVYGLGTRGQALSDHVGDLQGVSNIEAPQALRLYEAWVQQALLDDRLSVRAGLYDLNSEFYVAETAGLFLNSAHGIGPEFSQSGLNGPSIFPVTSLALRLRLHAPGGLYAQAAAFDAVPGHLDRPTQASMRWSRDEGALLTAEVGYEDARGAKVAAGAWRFSRAFEALDGGAPDHAYGAYVLGEQALYREPDAEQGLRAYARFGLASARVHQVRAAWGAGLAYTGLLPGRPGDQAGLAVAGAHNDATFLQAQRRAGVPTDAAEYAFEATYLAAFGPWLALQLDAQYIHQPGTDPTLADALVVGLRILTTLHP